jgi:hypothetical protein
VVELLLAEGESGTIGQRENIWAPEGGQAHLNPMVDGWIKTRRRTV